jgi:predicted HicB family RNase H-like nuclease
MKYEYKGYTGEATYHADTDDWYGHLTNTNDPVLFYSNSILELRNEFMNAVNEYIESFNNLSK